MTAQPVPSAFETRTNTVFEALMWALSRPGLPRELPDKGMAQIAEALIDRECAVECQGTDLADFFESLGARLVGQDEADHVFCDVITPDLPKVLRNGSDLYPDDGATLVARADFSSGPRLRLTGPGVDGAVIVTLGAIPEAFWTARKQVNRYPMGFEMFLLDGQRVLGIPRSTQVEVL